MRRGMAFAASVLVCAAAFADDLPPGYGVVAPSGSVFTTEISPAGDTDDYVFQGFPGTVLTATVTPAKGSSLVPDIRLTRPGGSLVEDEDGLRVGFKRSSLVATMPLDSTGWWQVRVLGVAGTTGGYSIAIRYTTPPASKLPVVPKGFRSFAAIEPMGDEDDHRFDGYRGQSLVATLRIPKGSALIPELWLIRPDGTEFFTDDIIRTTKSTTRLRSTLDQDGIWRIHLRGMEPRPDPDPNVRNNTTGTYTLGVRLGKPETPPSILPDTNDQYRFAVPGVGGATLVYVMR